MAISKLIFNGVIQMDVTGTTADENSVLSGYGAVGSDGQWFDGIASGGGGGLEYETGTYSPSEDIEAPTIYFSNTHTTVPMFVMISDQTGGYDSTSYTMHSWVLMNYSSLGYPLYYSSTGKYYAEIRTRYRNTSATSLSGVSMTENSATFSRVSASSFSPNVDTGLYWRTGRTYKWIAVWAPT